jgi:hypothetical protein
MPIRIHPRVLIQEVDGEAVLLDVDQGMYYALNEVGTRAWKYLKDSGDVEDAVTGILKEYEVDEATLRDDLHAFVKELVDNGLADEVPPA